MSQRFLIRTTTETDWQRVRELRIENATDNPISYGASLDYTLHTTESDWRLAAAREARGRPRLDKRGRDALQP